MRFVQHIPPFAETGAPPLEFAFKTIDELLANEWIARWKADRNFHRYSIARDHEPPLLMVEQDNGSKWWVIGRIFEPHEDELKKLPEWNRSTSSRRQWNNVSAGLPSDVVIIKRRRRSSE